MKLKTCTRVLSLASTLSKIGFQMGLFFKKKNNIADMNFDWDAYYNDIASNMSLKKRMKRMENLDYYVSVSEKSYGKIQVAEYAK